MCTELSEPSWRWRTPLVQSEWALLGFQALEKSFKTTPAIEAVLHPLDTPKYNNIIVCFAEKSATVAPGASWHEDELIPVSGTQHLHSCELVCSSLAPPVVFFDVVYCSVLLPIAIWMVEDVAVRFHRQEQVLRVWSYSRVVILSLLGSNLAWHCGRSCEIWTWFRRELESGLRGASVELVSLWRCATRFKSRFWSF